jgi:prepilin-type N-terminal cleavage/methylation domain-containing protein
MKRQNGFTLAEMAIVLLIIGLLLGGLLTPLSVQNDIRRVSETQKALAEIKEALIGYAAAQTPPHFPCPDKTTAAGVGTANDGQEDRNAGGTCVVREGNIPWTTLGISNADAWGNRFRYNVTSTFSISTGTTMSLASTGDIQICDTSACTTTSATNIPIVVLSHGKNGLGAININGGTNPAATSADELENTNGNTNYVSRNITDQTSPAGEFDDLVVWLPSSVIFSRLVAAGKLP